MPSIFEQIWVPFYSNWNEKSYNKSNRDYWLKYDLINHDNHGYIMDRRIDFIKFKA